MIASVTKITKEMDSTTVNRMNIALKESDTKLAHDGVIHSSVPQMFLINIWLFFSKRTAMKMRIVLKWRVMRIAHVMLDFLAMVRNIVFLHVVLVIGQMKSLENVKTSMSVLQ